MSKFEVRLSSEMHKLSAILLFLSIKLIALSQSKVIHVFVALCDNKYQGIVPVGAKIGNGQDPKNNLYWGCGYGAKMFFVKHSSDWTLLKTIPNPKKNVLERVVFKHKTQDCYMIADAYDGQFIKQTTIDMLESCAGAFKDSVKITDTKYVSAGGKADLIAYIGHDGLMDFQLESYPTKSNDKKRDAMIYACASKSFFKEAIKTSGATPLVWTTGLCSPEAYSLSFAVDAWLQGKNALEVRAAAAKGYSTYQKKCSLKAAMGLMATGY